jgi:hypothetical protein
MPVNPSLEIEIPQSRVPLFFLGPSALPVERFHKERVCVINPRSSFEEQVPSTEDNEKTIYPCIKPKAKKTKQLYTALSFRRSSKLNGFDSSKPIHIVLNKMSSNSFIAKVLEKRKKLEL